MGLPYSKQIHAAFEQVTPLVAAGFQVLQTTKNISILLAAIQVLTVVLLFFILLALLALLVALNPHLEDERDALVTPAMKMVAEAVLCLVRFVNGPTLRWMLGVIVVGCAVGVGWGLWYTGGDPTLQVEIEGDADGEEEMKGEDIEAIKEGEAKQ